MILSSKKISAKLILICLSFAMFYSCQKAEQRYAQNSPEIETVKSLINNYDNKDWAALKMHYADTSKTNFNNSKTMSIDDLIEYHQTNDVNYSSRGFVTKESEYEMVLTDDGETWVNFWGLWSGTLAANGEEVATRIHLTARFIDGKIVRDYGYWDSAPLILALQKIEAEKAAATLEETSSEEEN